MNASMGQIGSIQNRILKKSGKQVVLFRAMDGFGVPRALLEGGSIDGVEVTYDGMQYGAIVQEFFDHGVPFHRQPYEPQIILPRRYWKTREARRPN